MDDARRPEDGVRNVQGRGPAYPYVSLPRAVARAEQLRDANLARASAAPVAIYKIWGWSGDNGNARQTLAALNHFGLVEYVGRGDDRQVRLSDLALRIVLDKTPGSLERAAALKQAALVPGIHQRLWEQYGGGLPPDVVLETFLVRDCKFNGDGAANVIGEYKETLAFSGLDKPDEEPPSQAFVGGPANPDPYVSESAKGVRDQTPVQSLASEREWLRGPLSKDTSYRLLVSGEMGPREIGKLIRVLEAQRAVLSEDDEVDEE